MKQKTAMMELIEILERAKLHFVANRQIVCAIDSCKLCAVDLLKKEKEQIVWAYKDGFEDGCNMTQEYRTDYYNETYKQD